MATDEIARTLIRQLIAIIGDDPDREGLMDTPDRVVRSFEEVYAGYREPEPMLRYFNSETPSQAQAIRVNDIPFSSMCEHHMMAFTGTVKISYVPQSGLVVGLSKIPRLVDWVASRLQIQERIAAEVGERLLACPAVAAVAVEVTAEHHCMTARGIRAHGASMTVEWEGADYA